MAVLRTLSRFKSWVRIPYIPPIMSCFPRREGRLTMSQDYVLAHDSNFDVSSVNTSHDVEGVLDTESTSEFDRRMNVYTSKSSNRRSLRIPYLLRRNEVPAALPKLHDSR